MQRCARCKKRPAVVFITRMDNNQTVNEGLCLMCAKELGMSVFLLTDCLINDKNKDVSGYRQGGYGELLAYLRELFAPEN